MQLYTHTHTHTHTQNILFETNNHTEMKKFIHICNEQSVRRFCKAFREKRSQTLLRPSLCLYRTALLPPVGYKKKFVI